jgi:flagellar M-ring protein FliF
MPEQIIKVLTPIKDKWIALTRRQQIQLTAATAVLLLALVLILYFAFRTTWTDLYANRDFAEISPVVAALEAAGIRHRVHEGYTGVSVPARNRNMAFGIVHDSGSAAANMTIADMLDMTGLGTTEAERVALQHALDESGIRETLMSMDGIRDARVRVVQAERNLLFRPNQPPASLSVGLTTTRNFSQSEGRRLAEFLSTMVRGLSLENINIVDQHLNAIFIGGMEPENESAMDVFNHRVHRENQTASDLQDSLSHSFDRVGVMLNIQYGDHVGQEERILRFDAPDGTEDGLPVISTFSRSEAEGWWGIPWEPGIGANMQATPNYMLGDHGPSRASARDGTTQFRHNEHEIVISRGPGGMDAPNSTAAVMGTRDIYIVETDWFERNPNATRVDWLAYIDSYAPSYLDNDTEEISLIRSFAANAIGIPVDNVMVLIQGRHIIVHAEESSLPIPTIIMLAVLLLLIAMLFIALLARKKDEEEEELEPELSVEDLLATTQLEEAKEEEQRLKEINYEQENEIKKQIDKFVNEKPEAVAALLRNWLNVEEW